MAQEQESSSTSTSIPRVGKHSRGYDPRQVDAFVAQAHRLYDEGDPSLTLAGIQNASFAMVKGGYVPANVDAMLDRLKSAFLANMSHEIRTPLACRDQRARAGGLESADGGVAARIAAPCRP